MAEQGNNPATPVQEKASKSFEDIVHDLRSAAEDYEDERNAGGMWDGAQLAGIYREIARDIEEASAQVAAAQGTTDADAHMMTKEEAIVRLCALAFAAEDTDTLRALLLGCKALARAGVHKRRNHASRIARGIHG